MNNGIQKQNAHPRQDLLAELTGEGRDGVKGERSADQGGHGVSG